MHTCECSRAHPRRRGRPSSVSPQNWTLGRRNPISSSLPVRAVVPRTPLRGANALPSQKPSLRFGADARSGGHVHLPRREDGSKASGGGSPLRGPCPGGRSACASMQTVIDPPCGGGRPGGSPHGGRSACRRNGELRHLSLQFDAESCHRCLSTVQAVGTVSSRTPDERLQSRARGAQLPSSGTSLLEGALPTRWSTVPPRTSIACARGPRGCVGVGRGPMSITTGLPYSAPAAYAADAQDLIEGGIRLSATAGPSDARSR